jgi:dihydrofolate synthase / folylpolyglutamate synthase
MALTSYAEAVEFLYKNLPMFQRVGSAAYKPDLSNTIKLLSVLGNPQHKFKSIHVAGTNGKGSTSHMIASILQSSGYRTGLYTSPHLKSFTERIRIDGQEVDESFIVDFVNRIEPYIEIIKPSFFEITVAMAFEYFATQKVDVAVVEVGLGGRLDSTNVISPLLSVITNISWDHKEILGDTLEKIAGEKAGIIKPGVPVVISQRQSDLDQIFIRKADELGAPIAFADDEWSAHQIRVGDDIFYLIREKGRIVHEALVMPLHGLYQQYNLAGVFGAVRALKSLLPRISDEAVVHGLEHVISQTRLKGRWQKLLDHPLVICDTGHNIDGVTYVMRQVQRQKFTRLHIVWGMVKDKDITPILRLLPLQATYYFCNAKIPRAMPADELAAKAREVNLTGHVIPDVNNAYRRAMSIANSDDMILIGGSTFVVAEIEGL